MKDNKNHISAVVPKHLAIIMDGNHRWARQRVLPGLAGHRYGARNVRPVVEACADLGVSCLTLFAFSTENWQRPKAEVDLLMGFVSETIQRELPVLQERGIRLDFIGDRTMLPKEVQSSMLKGERETQEGSAFRLIIALNYGGRWDIVQAAQTIAEEVAAGRLAPNDVDNVVFNKKLALSSLVDVPTVDLCIRTGGDVRLSNFLMWDLAYSELFFTETYWPDFGQAQLADAFHDFSNRHRRYGTRMNELKTRAAH